MRLPLRYYLDAINHLGVSPESKYLALVGDDLRFLHAIKGSHFPNASVSNGDLFSDCRQLINSQTIVISNSSLAWWMAALNRFEPTVVAPRHWLGFKIDKTVPPGIDHGLAEWKWLPVNRDPAD